MIKYIIGLFAYIYVLVGIIGFGYQEPIKIDSEAKQEPIRSIQKDSCDLNSVVCENESIEADTTAYSEIDSCHYEGCPMASGKRAYVGAVACPRSISLGTKVIIDDKLYTCEDRTAKKYDGRFDIFMGYGEDSYNKALNYGIKKSKVEFIN